MRVLGLLAFLIIGLFIILMGFLSVGDDNVPVTSSSENGGKTQNLNTTSQALPLPTPQNMELQYQMKQMEKLYQAQMEETRLKYQHELERQRYEYQNLQSQQKMLNDGQSQQQLLNHEKNLTQQQFQKDLLMQQQQNSAEQQAQAQENTLTGRIIDFESQQQQQKFIHEQTLALKKSEAQQQKISVYLTAAVVLIALLAAMIYILFSRYTRARVELQRMSHDQALMLEEHKALQETRMKVLDAITDFPAEEKKEIISGFINGRQQEQLQHEKYSKADELILDIDLEDLNPPDRVDNQRKA